MTPEGHALVTGASRGLGRSVALELARRGFDVVAGMRDPGTGEGLPDEAARAGGRLRVARLDVLEPESIAIPAGLRVLVNNAGIEGAYLAVEQASGDLWRELFETNVFGLVETTRRALPVLRASGGGVVCNITSASLLMPMPLYAAYRASKAAVAALGESLRTEVRPFGIRVIEILPGPIDTDMLTGSDRLPEASESETYRLLSDQVLAARRSVAEITPPEVAARSIVDAILDDSGPLRHACDPLGRSLLASWRASSDEQMMAGMLELFTPPDAD